jgi:hypothetical protein
MPSTDSRSLRRALAFMIWWYGGGAISGNIEVSFHAARSDRLIVGFYGECLPAIHEERAGMARAAARETLSRGPPGKELVVYLTKSFRNIAPVCDPCHPIFAPLGVPNAFSRLLHLQPPTLMIEAPAECSHA